MRCERQDVTVGELVFAAGSKSFVEARSLFGGAAERLVVPGARVIPLDSNASRTRGILLALAATALHAIRRRRRSAIDHRTWRAWTSAGAPGQ